MRHTHCDCTYCYVPPNALWHEMYCDDCRATFVYSFEEDGNTVINPGLCAECGSNAVRQLLEVQREYDRKHEAA